MTETEALCIWIYYYRASLVRTILVHEEEIFRQAVAIIEGAAIRALDKIPSEIAFREAMKR